MAKNFYTEKDIEELFNNGTKSLHVNDDVSLTDLAYEKAKRLGLQLLFDGEDLPPIAPIRPYLSSASPRSKPVIDSASQPALHPNGHTSQKEMGTNVTERIRSAVIARLGNQVDAKLLDTIIQRVLKSTGMK